ncbi:uncharacterized protein Dwil_GK21491 [Drosophila willistoni]|nr:uncharacterized protein Dwil_GK21491 [Drosophila willistoni]
MQIHAKFIQDFGLEADRSVLRHLFTVLNFSDPKPNSTSQWQAKLLGAILERQLQSSSFVSSICFAVDQHFAANQKTVKPTELIGQVSRLTGINKLCECIFALAVTHSSYPELQQSARDNLRSSLPELLDSYLGNNNRSASAAASGLQDISSDLLQYLLSCLNEFVTPQLEGQFLNKLREEFPRQTVPLILAPFLYGTTKTTATQSIVGSVQASPGETDAETETGPGIETTTASSSTTSNNNTTVTTDADTLNEVGIEDIYDHLCEIIFSSQVIRFVYS